MGICVSVEVCNMCLKCVGYDMFKKRFVIDFWLMLFLSILLFWFFCVELFKILLLLVVGVVSVCNS